MCLCHRISALSRDVPTYGLHRLNVFDPVFMHYLPKDIFIPAIGQGILAIQTRENDGVLKELLQDVNDSIAETAARMERSLLVRFQGNCNLPIGALATFQNSTWRLRAFICGVKSHRVVHNSVEFSDPEQCKEEMIKRLLDDGAAALLTGALS